MKPDRDTVLYDGKCRFCRSQIAILRRLDWPRSLEFRSLHDASVASDFPEISQEAMMREMFMVDRSGHTYAGAKALRKLSRRLPLLWPLAVLLHIPGSLPVWNSMYRLVARNRYLVAGSCDEGSCHLH